MLMKSMFKLMVLWGVHVHKLELLQKKALHFMTYSGYIVHTTPMLIKHGLLKADQLHSLKNLHFV